MALLEYFDGSNWIALNALSSITLTGAITGSGLNTINTTLGNTQNMNSTFLNFNWSNSGSFAEYSIYHLLQDSSPPPQIVYTYQAGTHGLNTYRWWNLIFQPGLSSQPTGNFQIDFVHNVSGRKTPFKITSVGSGFTTYLSSILDMGNNQINNLGTPVSAQDAVNKNYADTSVIAPSRITGYPSNSSLFLNGSGGWSAPSFSDLITTSASIYSLTINNTNTSATATGLLIQNNGNNGVAFGFNNSTNEAYVWAYNTASLKFGTAATMRAQILNNGTFDLLSNTLTTTGTINATTGTLKGNNLAAYNSVSIVVGSPLAMSNNSITGLANPINNQDAATKSYVDSNASGLSSNSININTTGGLTNWIRRSNNTTTGVQVYSLSSTSLILENNLGESAGIGFDGNTDTCTIWTAGDSGWYLNIQDEDSTNSRVAYVASNTGAWTTVSSKQRKHSIREKTNNNVLDRFLKLSVKTYGYKYDIDSSFSEKRKQRMEKKKNKMAIGLILEELFDIFPNCIPDYYNELFQEKDRYKKLDLNKELRNIANSGIDYNILFCYFIMAFQEFVQKTNNDISELKGKL